MRLRIVVMTPTSYVPYTKNVGVITTILNLMELHYILLSTCGNEVADVHFNRLFLFVMSISNEIIKEANKLKLLHNKRELSYIDCIWYYIAHSRSMKFLTGDKQFK